MNIRQIIADTLKRAARERGYSVTACNRLNSSILVIYSKKRFKHAICCSFVRVEVTRTTILVYTPNKRFMREKDQYAVFSPSNPNPANDVLDCIKSHVDVPTSATLAGRYIT